MINFLPPQWVICFQVIHCFMNNFFSHIKKKSFKVYCCGFLISSLNDTTSARRRSMLSPIDPPIACNFSLVERFIVVLIRTLFGRGGLPLPARVRFSSFGLGLGIVIPLLIFDFLEPLVP
jgi:hypothetical protein